jgi:hypothetical protein
MDESNAKLALFMVLKSTISSTPLNILSLAYDVLDVRIHKLQIGRIDKCVNDE